MVVILLQPDSHYLEENVPCLCAVCLKNQFAATINNEITILEIIDAEINPYKFDGYNILSQMEPYGPENVSPFLLQNVPDTGAQIVEQHVRLGWKTRTL